MSRYFAGAATEAAIGDSAALASVACLSACSVALCFDLDHLLDAVEIVPADAAEPGAARARALRQ